MEPAGVFTLSYILVGHHVVIGLGLVALGAVFGSIGGGADQAMVADLVPPEPHEAAYASVRVASNLGVTFGPPIGGLLLIGRHWPVLFSGVAALSLIGFAIAFRYLPRRVLRGCVSGRCSDRSGCGARRARAAAVRAALGRRGGEPLPSAGTG